MSNSSTTMPGWMKGILWVAAVYNLVWGTAVVFFPSAYFYLVRMELPRYPFLWQCLGMVIGVYGLGYAIAATDPNRHWPIILVGLLGKLFGPIGFIFGALRGDVPWNFGWTLLANDLIWWLPFGFILLRVYQNHRQTR